MPIDAGNPVYKVTYAEKKAEKTQRKARKPSYTEAAKKYVNQGLSELKLTERQKNDLRKKLQPIVERQMKSERQRTANRATSVAKRERKKIERLNQWGAGGASAFDWED